MRMHVYGRRPPKRHRASRGLDVLSKPDRQVIEKQTNAVRGFGAGMHNQPDFSLESDLFGKYGDEVGITHGNVHLAAGYAKSGSQARHLRTDIVSTDGKVLASRQGRVI